MNKITKVYANKNFIIDTLFIIFFCAVWAAAKKIFSILGNSSNKLQIGSIDLNLSISAIAHYFVYIVIIFLITHRVIRFVDRLIAEILRGRARKRFILTKIANILIYLIAILMLLDVLSVDIKIIAAVGGTIGLGLGLGLQKITSNFLSGLILFAEQSVRLYDIIETNDKVVGVVKQISPRYVLLETSDGKEIFIPNEELIINKVTNWTHSNNICRDDFNLVISQNSDSIKAVNIITEIINSSPNVAKEKTSSCFISGYNEFGIILTLHVWVDNIGANKDSLRDHILSNTIKRFIKNDIKMPAQNFNINLIK